MASKRFRRFINENLPALWRIAQEGYRSWGRGVVRFAPEDLGEPTYGTQAEPGGDGLWDPGMDRLVSNYDPETQFVCAILEAGAVADIALVDQPDDASRN